MRIVVPKYNLAYFPWIPFSGSFQTDSATLLQTVYLLSALKAALNHFQQKVQSLFFHDNLLNLFIWNKFLFKFCFIDSINTVHTVFFSESAEKRNLFPTLDPSFSKGKKDVWWKSASNSGHTKVPQWNTTTNNKSIVAWNFQHYVKNDMEIWHKSLPERSSFFRLVCCEIICSVRRNTGKIVFQIHIEKQHPISVI